MPVGRFEYNPGVQPVAAQIFANSNARFGEMLMSALTMMGQVQERKQNKIDALTLDAKSADATFKADLATVGDDEQAQNEVLKKWGVGSTDQFGHLSAQDKVARRDGVITSEKLTEAAGSFQAKMQDILTQKKSAGVLAKLLAGGGGAPGGASQDTEDVTNRTNGTDGTDVTDPADLLLRAAKLSPQDRADLLAGGVGQNAINQARAEVASQRRTVTSSDARLSAAQIAADQKQAQLDEQIRKNKASEAIRQQNADANTKYRAIAGPKNRLAAMKADADILEKEIAALPLGADDQKAAKTSQLEHLRGMMGLLEGDGAEAPASGRDGESAKGKQLTPAIAKKFLDDNGGDKAKARKAAKVAGYDF